MDLAAETLRDPVLFTQCWLRHETWGIQEEILHSIANNRRTAVKGCHASSKTHLAAEAVLWWVARFPDGACLTTGPTGSQVKHNLWKKIHAASGRSRFQIPEIFQTELRMTGPDAGVENFAIGLSTNQGVRFQGFHGHLLVIIDEGPGVEPQIWEAIHGMRAGGEVHILTLGNPTVPIGPFFDAFADKRTTWTTFTISAFDTPNFEGITLEELLSWDADDERLDDNKLSYLISRRFVWEMAQMEEWGVSSPIFESRILGIFPKQGEDALISLAWLEAAQAKPRPEGNGTLWAGVDVAGPGEAETVLYIVEDIKGKGTHIVEMHTWPEKDPRGKCRAALRPYKDRLRCINVDAVGIGYYFARYLKDDGFRVEEINVGEASSAPASDREPEFFLEKAHHFWNMRGRFAGMSISGLVDDKTVAQCQSIRYEHDSRGRIAIKSKDAMRSLGVKSPDRAEALMLALIRGPVTMKIPTLLRGE